MAHSRSDTRSGKEIPSPLGTVVRIVSPAGPVTEGDLDRGIEVLAGKGYLVEEAPHVRERTGYLAGRDEDRTTDLREALEDPHVDIVWFARGGYGTQRLLQGLGSPGRRSPGKVIAGYSDATALFLWAEGNHRLRCFYAPSVQELGRRGVCRLSSLWGALRGKPLPIPGEGPGRVAGPAPVIGGCLSLVVTASGTPWVPDMTGKFLFLEDVGESLYRLDRMLTHLQHAGWFGGVAGILLGAFTGLPDGETSEDVAKRIREMVPVGTPVVTSLPVGHRKGKYTLPLGVPALWNGKTLSFR